jgi:hypothetical protein
MKKDVIKKYQECDSPRAWKGVVKRKHGEENVNSAYQELGELSPQSHKGQGDEKVNSAYQELGELSPPSTYESIR